MGDISFDDDSQCLKIKTNLVNFHFPSPQGLLQGTLRVHNAYR